MLFKYAYLIANVFFLLVWLFVYWRLKSLRRQILILSLITASFGPISELWYFADYWRPVIALPLPVIGGVEDVLFGFSIGGIAAFIYEALFVRKICYCVSQSLKREWFLLVFFLVEGLTMVVLNNLAGINSIFASSIGMLMIAAIMLYLRPDLIVNALGSALLVAGIMFAIYFFGQTLFHGAHGWMSRIWKLYKKPEGVLIFTHVPLTEMIWGLSWGLVWGPMYEFLTGARTLTIKPMNVFKRV